MVVFKVFIILVLFYICNAKLDYQSEFDQFVKSNNRIYKDENERNFRFQTFVENLEEIAKFSQDSKGTAKFGLNKFSDWTKEEKTRLTPYSPKAQELSKQSKALGTCLSSTNTSVVLPKNFDWRDSKIVTPVKDQGQCGSCWAFATIAVVEAQIVKKTGQYQNLSEQELVDCALNLGCNGGAPSLALTYIELNGIANETTYPYEAKDQKCQANIKGDNRGHIDTWACIDLDEDSAAYWLTKIGPIVYDIWVPDALYSYKSGVLWPSELDCLVGITKFAAHAVTIVGFGEENGVPYWLIKNSWGSDWGDNGYFKIHRGDKACAIGLPHTAAVIWPL
uniref:Uncharacterized protein n=1 Tax=Acrobeloides nanus TaxID=290746 RepID=A0A914BZG9_9BILA